MWRSNLDQLQAYNGTYQRRKQSVRRWHVEIVGSLVLCSFNALYSDYLGISLASLIRACLDFVKLPQLLSNNYTKLLIHQWLH